MRASAERGRVQGCRVPGACQPTYGGGKVDAWVAKLNKTGSALVYSTYLGGTALGLVADLTVDRSGSAYIPGDTISEDFPTTPAPSSRPSAMATPMGT